MNFLTNQLTLDTKNMLCCCWFKEFMKIWDLKFVNPVDEQLTILGLGFKWDVKKDLTPLFLTWFSSKAYDPYMHSGYTLDSGINVGPTFIIFVFFPGPTALLKALRLSNFGIFSMAYRYFQVWWVFCNINLHILFMPYVYSRPYVYSFWQIFQALWLFPALRLFQTLEYGHPMKAEIKDIWKIGPMWQTKICFGCTEKFGIGIEFSAVQ